MQPERFADIGLIVSATACLAVSFGEAARLGNQFNKAEIKPGKALKSNRQDAAIMVNLRGAQQMTQTMKYSGA